MRYSWKILTILLLTPACLYSFSEKVEKQFSSTSNIYDKTQKNGSGDDASIELMYQWESFDLYLNQPPARYNSQIAYSSGTKVIVIFGGVSDSGSLNDTWECNLSTPGNPVWQNYPISEPWPSGRSEHGLVSIGKEKVLLYGGASVSGSSETWIYNSSDHKWTYSNLDFTPGMKKNFAMACDTLNQKVVIFGGWDLFSSSKSSETWVYDVSAGTWSFRNHVNGPSAREGCAMAYKNGSNEIYLYGGTGVGGGGKEELWKYDVVTDLWSYVTPITGLKPDYINPGMFFDIRNSHLVVYGGVGAEGIYSEIMWHYKDGNTSWLYDVPKDTPTVRRAHGLTYVATLEKAFLFGGRYNTQNLDDTCFYTYRSTGVFYYESGIDVSVGAQIQWLKLSLTPATQLGPISIEFQVAVSTDNNWEGEIYSGPSGTQSDSYLWAGVPIDLCSGYSNNNYRYLKYKIILKSFSLLKWPCVDSVTITYNRSPVVPILSTPFNGNSSSATPVFTWSNSSDDDGDTLTYSINVSKQSDLAAPVISSSGIAQGGGGFTSFSTTTLLSHGTWYWGVNVNDATVDDWSSSFIIHIDTIPPSMVTDLTSITGLGNGELRLNWTSPGDDGISGLISQYAKYKVYYSTNPEMTPNSMQQINNNRDSIYSLVPGQSYIRSITGLADATTYYFAIEIGDEAENYSVISAASNPAFTNAAPQVQIISPTEGVVWSMVKEIQWSSSDKNSGDTWSFNIFASSDAGSSYGIIIATGLPHGTTHYLWDTRIMVNGNQQKIKIEVIDLRKLMSYDTTGYFTITNNNESPTVNIVVPFEDQVLSDSVQFSWILTDVNGGDTHTYDLYISSNGGSSFFPHFSTLSNTFNFNTNQYANGPNYRLRIVAADQGGKWGEDFVNFKINNLNVEPNSFSLLYPQNGSSQTPVTLDFGWVNNGDQNSEDYLTYTFYCSTNSDFSSGIVTAGININSYKINPETLTYEGIYYWKVVAIDPLGSTRTCNNSFTFTLNRLKAVTSDGRMEVEILNDLPAGVYLKVGEIDSLLYSSINVANQDTIADRHIKSLGDISYLVSIRDINDNIVFYENPSILLRITYPDTDSDGFYDGTRVPLENLRIGFLNETSGKWELAPSFASVDKVNRCISINLKKTGIVTLLGALTPTNKISAVVNYPNPFAAGKSTTKIKYVLTENSNVTVTIYTLLGDMVWKKEFSSGNEGGKGQATGYTNEMTWDGRNDSGIIVANGMYLAEIKAGSEKTIRKIGVVK